MAQHTNGKQWDDRELNRASLTEATLDAAMQAAAKTIQESPEAPGSDAKKTDLQNRLRYSLTGELPPGVTEPMPLPQRYKTKPPKTVGELGQRIDRIAGNLGDDPYMQEMCRAASKAATVAAKEAIVASGTEATGQSR